MFTVPYLSCGGGGVRGEQELKGIVHWLRQTKGTAGPVKQGKGLRGTQCITTKASEGNCNTHWLKQLSVYIRVLGVL